MINELSVGFLKKSTPELVVILAVHVDKCVIKSG